MTHVQINMYKLIAYEMTFTISQELLAYGAYWSL